MYARVTRPSRVQSNTRVWDSQTMEDLEVDNLIVLLLFYVPDSMGRYYI